MIGDRITHRWHELQTRIPPNMGGTDATQSNENGGVGNTSKISRQDVYVSIDASLGVCVRTAVFTWYINMNSTLSPLSRKSAILLTVIIPVQVQHNAILLSYLVILVRHWSQGSGVSRVITINININTLITEACSNY